VEFVHLDFTAPLERPFLTVVQRAHSMTCCSSRAAEYALRRISVRKRLGSMTQESLIVRLDISVRMELKFLRNTRVLRARTAIALAFVRSQTVTRRLLAITLKGLETHPRPGYARPDIIVQEALLRLRRRARRVTATQAEHARPEKSAQQDLQPRFLAARVIIAETVAVSLQDRALRAIIALRDRLQRNLSR